MKTSKNNFRFIATSMGITAPLWIMSSAVHADVTIFDNIPSPLAPNYSSLGYEATSASEFGTEVVTSAGDSEPLSSASVVLSNWAPEDDSAYGGPDYTSFDDGQGGYDQALTLNFYNLNATDPTLPGSQIGSVTQTFNVLWRPPTTGTGADGTYYTVGGQNYSGLAQTVTFNLASAGITVPDQFIYTLAFNTEDYGASPTHVAGPYDSLNFAVVSGDPSNPGTPSVGSYANPDDVFWNTSDADFYTDPTLHGGGVLQEDSEWTGYQPAASFTAVPEPTTLSLLSVGALALLRRRKRSMQ